MVFQFSQIKFFSGIVFCKQFESRFPVIEPRAISKPDKPAMDQRIIIAPVILIERIKQNIKVYIMKNSGAVYLQIDVRTMLKEQRQGIGSDILVPLPLR